MCLFISIFISRCSVFLYIILFFFFKYYLFGCTGSWLRQAVSLVVALELLVVACMWDRGPWPETEPGHPALGAHSLMHCTTRQVPHIILNVANLKALSVVQWIKKFAKSWEITLLREYFSHGFCNFSLRFLKIAFLQLLELEGNFYYLFIYLIYLIYFWLRWVFVAQGLSLVAASGGYCSLQCTGFSLQWLLLLQSTGPRHAGFSSCGTRAQ